MIYQYKFLGKLPHHVIYMDQLVDFVMGYVIRITDTYIDISVIKKELTWEAGSILFTRAGFN